jgi:hypothetical protein
MTNNIEYVKEIITNNLISVKTKDNKILDKHINKPNKKYISIENLQNFLEILKEKSTNDHRWIFKEFNKLINNKEIGVIYQEEFIVYENDNTKIYIHPFEKEKNRKLVQYGIRRDDHTGFAHLLGLIKFNGGWRQYITEFKPNTIWSAGCKEKICEFERMMNEKWKKNIKK